MLINISESATGTLVPVVLPGVGVRGIAEFKETPGLLSKLFNLMYCNPETSLPMRALLSKIGVRDLKGIRAMTTSYFKSATVAEAEAFVPKALQTKIVDAWTSKYALRIAYNKNYYNKVKLEQPALVRDVKSVMLMAVRVYLMLSMKTCASLGIDHAKSGKAVLGFLMFGTSVGGTVPLAVKRLFPKASTSDVVVDKKAAKVAPSVELEGLTIDTLKLKHFKGPNAQRIVDALPEMYKEYIKDLPAPKPKAQNLYGVKNRSSYTRLIVAKNMRDAHTARIADVIEHDVGPEIFGFLEHLVPALKANASYRLKLLKNGAGKSKLYNAKSALRHQNWRLKRTGKFAPAPAMKVKILKAVKELQAKIDEYEINPELDEAQFALDNRVKAWMLPFLDSTVKVTGVSGKKMRVILGDGILIHRLVTKANAGTLKIGAPELLCALDTANANMLTYKGVAKIIGALGDSTIKSFATVFKDVADFVKPKVFTVAITDLNSGTLVTPTGNVTDARLLRLNSITAQDEREVVKQYAKHFAAWKPLKIEVMDFVDSIQKTAVEKAHTFEVTKSSAAALAKYRKEMPQYMTNLHGVDLRIMSAWDVKPTKTLTTVLSNATKAASSKLEVIRDVFHGTSRQTGSIILSCGFKVEGTQVTARSMGDVLYVAPNIDKSAQYMKASGGYSRAAVTGLIFMGDVVVSGPPKSEIRGKGTGFDWTKTGSFATEEIGLASPNTQFVIRKAFLVKVLPLSSTQRKAVRNSSRKFKPKAPISTYTV